MTTDTELSVAPLTIGSWKFHGEIGDGEWGLDFEGQIEIDGCGVVRIDFPEMEMSERTRKFAFQDHDLLLRLKGETEEFAFSSGQVRLLGKNMRSGPDGSFFKQKAEPLVIELEMACIESILPVVTVWLRSAKLVFPVRVATKLGNISLLRVSSDGSEGAVTACIVLQALAAPVTIDQWKLEASDFLDYLAKFWSLACGQLLKRPVETFDCYGNRRIKYLLQTRVNASAIPILGDTLVTDFIQVCAKAYFSDNFPKESLMYAVDWLLVATTYSEIRLLSAMTALEHLIDGNLLKISKEFLSRSKFEKLSKGIRSEITRLLDELDIHDPEIREGIKTKVAELNRKSLREKMNELAKNWNVDLSDIPVEVLESAKMARDHIIHRGRYKPSKQSTPEVWGHFAVIREVVVRLVFSRIGYRGQYISHFGGFHCRQVK